MNFLEHIGSAKVGAGFDGAREGELIRGKADFREEAAEEAEGVSSEAVGSKGREGGIPDEEVGGLGSIGEEDRESLDRSGALGVEGDESGDGEPRGVEAGGEEVGVDPSGLGEVAAGSAELKQGNARVEIGVKGPPMRKGREAAEEDRDEGVSEHARWGLDRACTVIELVGVLNLN